MGYCARSDVYAIGIAPEAFRRPPREVEAVLPSSGIFTIRSHGLVLNTPLVPAVLSSSTLGAAPAAMPAGCPAVGTTCYAIPIASDTFQIATSKDGPAITFSDSGSGIFGFVVDHGPYLDAAISAASAVFDQYARAHAAPISAAIAPVLCAYLAARIYIAAHAPNDPKLMAAAEAPSWLRGILDKLFTIYLSEAPILGAVDATPTVADAGAKLVPLRHGDFDLCTDGGGLDVA